MNLFAYVGLPVQKRALNPSIDHEFPATVREVSDFNAETPAKVVEIVDPNANLNLKPWFNPSEQFECGPEIPIVLVDKGKETVIMRSTASHDLQWDRYKKVSEMKIRTEYGYEKTLEQLLAEISQSKAPTAPLRFRPVPTMIQAGFNATNVNPVTSQPINSVTQYQGNRSTCNPCGDESVKTRPNFPAYAPESNDKRHLSRLGLMNASSFRID